MMIGQPGQSEMTTDTIDAWPQLRPDGEYLYGKQDLVTAINLKVSPNDGMYQGNDAHYLQVGASALRLIEFSLAAVNRKMAEIDRVLDYACGFGRVLRWLCAEFPHADIAAADADAKAIDAVKRLFDVAAFTLDRSLKEDIGSDFDLIWVGSLATHLPQEILQALLHRLQALLSSKGVLVLTTHGPYVAGRIARGEKNYLLDAKGVKRFLRTYENDGFGFSPYPDQETYGISACTASMLMSMFESARLRPIFFQERGWVKHQDCIAAIKSGDFRTAR